MNDRLRLALVALLALALLAPTVRMGFYADDYLHQSVLAGGDARVPMRPWALYDFGSFEEWRALDGLVGSFPWWTGADWRVRFFRPLTSAVLWGEFALFGGWSPGYHLVGMGLFVLLLALVRRLYAVLGLAPRTALLGTLLVALSHTAVLPAGWPANLNSLLAALCAAGSLALLLGSRAPSAARLGAGLSLAVGAALANESGVVALLLAAFVCARHARGASPARARLWLACGTALALVVVHLGGLFLGGYGTCSLFYATPWEDPARFLRNLLVLASAAPVAFVAPFPLDLIQLVPRAAPGLIASGVLLGVPLVVWVTRTVRHLPGADWLATWTLLFLGMQAGAMPSARLLFLPEIGAAGLLALFLAERRRLAAQGRTRVVGRVATRALGWTGTVGSGLCAFVMAAGLAESARFVRERILETEVGAPALGQRELFVLQAPNQMQAFALHTTWRVESPDHELTFRLLQAGPRPVRWTRTGERTFELETLAEPFLALPFERVYRTSADPIAVGQRYQSLGLQVEVLAVAEGLPTRLAFAFERPLEDPRVLFLAPEGARLARVALPAIGDSRELPRPHYDGPWIP